MDGKKRTAYRVSVGKPEGNSPLARPTCKLVDIIKIDLK
jgi:hypothetical protein